MKLYVFIKKHFVSFLSAAICATVFNSPLLAAPTDPNFTTDFIVDGVGATKIDFDHAGRMYSAQKRGRLMRSLPNGSGGFQDPVEMLNIQSQVNSDLEAGLLGMTLDPDFANNIFIYQFSL
jgi:hypothetical protein